MADDSALDTGQEAEADENHGSGFRLSDHISRNDLIGLCALTVALIAAFYPQMTWMWGRWMNSEYYGHGFFIVPISAYLIYRRREALAELPKSQDWRGLALLAFGVLIHLFGCQVDVNFISAFALVFAVAGAVWWLWGATVAVALAFPLAYLCFMVPIDRLLIDGFSSPLQLLAANVGAGFAQMLGIPIVREGVNISVPDYTFEVAIACSGLKSSITLVALATLYGYLTEGAIWKRIVLVASSVPIALLANSVRIAAILIVAQAMSAEAAEGFFHNFSGIVVFMVGLVGLYAIGRAIGCHNTRDDI
ncbi:MAG TPA: exosortase A [Armatimonadota bacterium]|nr:exosortase A [Armatimonadota bacterium]